jgi:hypothetical protein
MSELVFLHFQAAFATSAVVWAYAILAFPAVAMHFLIT